MRVIKSRLEEMLPELKLFLDVDVDNFQVAPLAWLDLT